MSRLLLDTHALLWWWSDDPSLSDGARRAVSDSSAEVYVSAASAWEIATKSRLGRLQVDRMVILRFGEAVAREAFRHLPITHAHAVRVGSYETAPPDPFDRMLAAQAEFESLTLVTTDRAFGRFPVETLW